MSGLFHLLGLGARSLLAAQLAQATVGNNAANEATPGYSRRRPMLVEAPPLVTGIHVLGSGVQVVGLERIRDRMLDTQFRLDSQDLHWAQAQLGILDQMGALLSPADASPILAALDGLWGAFGDLAARPEDGAVRRTVVAQAQSFADAVRLARTRVEDLMRDAWGALGDRVAEVNRIAARLAGINISIRASGDPAVADERDRLIDRLAELIGVRASVFDDGTAQVVVNGTGIQLVDGPRAAALALTGTALGGTATVTVDGTALPAAGGEIGGLLELRNSTTAGLPHAIGALDQLAAGVIDNVNRLHAGGAGLTLAATYTGSTVVGDPAVPLSAAGLAFPPTGGTLALGVFTAAGALVSTASVPVDPATMSLDALAAAIDALPDVSASVSGGRLVVSASSPANRVAFGADSSGSLAALGVNAFFSGSDARTIAVDASLSADPSRIAAAQADLTAGLVSPGDGRNAASLAALGQARLLAGGTETPAEFLGEIGATVGAAGRAARTQADLMEAVVQAVGARRQGASGVNLDEELTDMVRYQHAYEASARFISTVDEMLEALLRLV